MSILIKKIGDKFTARITPPHGKGHYWETIEPLDINVLVEKLLERGCHPIDIGDELYKIDPKLIGL